MSPKNHKWLLFGPIRYLHRIYRLTQAGNAYERLKLKTGFALSLADELQFKGHCVSFLEEYEYVPEYFIHETAKVAIGRKQTESAP